MSDRNYLDELDSLMDNPAELERVTPDEDAKAETIIISSTKASEHNAVEASHTWANIIEQASHALQDGTQTAQEIAQKNLDLAKTQNESIKDLVDAASGWRHATRQAVQEVNSAKKNVIILTVISGVIAIAGFGTTIGVMLQSRAGFVSMSNSVLENVDEHQSLVSKTLTLKIDELASTIEQMQASLDQLATNNATKAQTNEQQVTADKTDNAASNTGTALANGADNKPSNTTTSTNTNDVKTTNAVASNTANAPVNTQLSDKLAELQNQLVQLEASFSKNQQELQQQLGQLPATIDEKITTKLTKTIAAMPPANAQPTSTAVVNHPDNKIVLEQIARLRQDIGEIKSLQTALKEQIMQLKQSNGEAKPYQYRTTPDIESYPPR